MIAQLFAQAAHLVYTLVVVVTHLPAPVQAALALGLASMLLRKVGSSIDRRPVERRIARLDRELQGCACLACKARRQPAAPAERAAPAEPAGAAMPAPSAGVAPPPAAAPCTHGGGVEAVWAGGELMRYTCANFRCHATWPPGTAFPAGTTIHGGQP
jgi:hypothetical protein